MINKCLVTKLQGVVDNDSLLKMGEVRFTMTNNIYEDSEPNNSNFVINTGNTIEFSESCYVRVNSGAYTLMDRYESTADGILYIRPKKGVPTTFSIKTKYNIRFLNIFRVSDLNIEGKYLSKLKIYTMNYSPLKERADVNLFKRGESVNSISITENCGAELDISNNKVVPIGDLNGVAFSGKGNNIYGKLVFEIPSGFSGLNANMTINECPDIEFDVSQLLQGSNFNYSSLSFRGSAFEMNVATLGDYMRTNNITVTGGGFRTGYGAYGDISMFPSDYMNGTGGEFTWERTRPSTMPIMGIHSDVGYPKVNFGNYVDAMLINMANLTIMPDSTNAWRKMINVKGVRTSASDAAVATLTAKGMTVTITT